MKRKIIDLFIENGIVYYHIEVLLAQIWYLKKRYSDFDEMHRKLRRDLDPINLPKLPEKKYFFSMHPEFIEARMRSLHEYLKSIILIYEALENPILQRFLEIDITYDPNFEYLPIEFKRPSERVFKKRSMTQHFSDKKIDTLPIKTEKLEIKSRQNHRSSSVSKGARKRKGSKKRSNSKEYKSLGESIKKFKIEKVNSVKDSPLKDSDSNSFCKFDPEEIKKEKGYTNADIPKFRYFDPKMETPIIENDADFISLDGADDPFPLSPDEELEKELREKQLEDIKKEIKSMRIKTEELNNMNYSRLDADPNESVRNILDEYENLDESKASGIKLLVKRATKWVTNMTKENAEYFALKHRAEDIQRSIEDWANYYSNIHTKLKIIAKYIKEKESS